MALLVLTLTYLRLIILYLILNELIDVPVLYLISYTIANKPEYHLLINQTNLIGKWEEWIMFMLNAVESTSKDTITSFYRYTYKEMIRQLAETTQEVLGN